MVIDDPQYPPRPKPFTLAISPSFSPVAPIPCPGRHGEKKEDCSPKIDALTGNVRWMLSWRENLVKIIWKICQHQIFMAEALSFGL
jgi:hypothetical protein